MRYAKIIKQYGLKSAQEVGEQLNSCCPFHNDANPSFSINMRTGKWICYKGCGAGDFVKFVSLIEDISREDAAVMVKDWVWKGQPDDHLLKTTLQIIQQLKMGKQQKPSQRPEPINEEILKRFDYTNYDYMLSRGFKLETLQEFGIGYYKGHVTIPVRDESARLIAVVARSIEAHGAKYLPLVPKLGYKKSGVLFGLDKVLPNVTLGMVVEGPLDVVRAFQEGFRGAVALQGSMVSNEQVRLLLKRFNQLIIATDNDDAGRTAKKRIIRALKKKMLLFEFTFPKGVKDVGELDTNGLRWGIEHMRLV